MEAQARKITDVAKIRQFIMAGKAKLTFRSVESGNRFTYEIVSPKGKRGDDKSPRFVRVLSGSNNESDFTYLGTLFPDGNYQHGQKSPFSKGVQSELAFQWALKHIAKGTLPANLEVWHEGCCGRCGRTLTVPESIESGYGPECVNLVRR